MELEEGGEGRDGVIYAHSKVREPKKKAKGSKVASLPQCSGFLVLAEDSLKLNGIPGSQWQWLQ